MNYAIDKNIMECELEYSKCFSEYYEDDEIIRFYDNELRDMYYHNYTFIKKAMESIDLKRIIENEIALKLSINSDFCNIISNYDVNSSIFYTLKYKPEISINGYYSFDISNFSKIIAMSECIIEKVDNQKMIDDILFCDLQHDGEKLGKEFCTNRCYRRGKVYISDKGVNSYVCYHNGNIIGNCNLLIHDGVSKIEDFTVIPTYQRKGYGTALLKKLIDIAIKENSHTIYLVTDEDDTPKEMYKKLGFNKIGERTDLFFKL